MAALQRRLRLVLFLVLVVLPLAMTGILTWFVSSDSWTRQVAAAIAEHSGMQVSLADIAFSAADTQRLQDLKISDPGGSECFSASVLEAQGFVPAASRRQLSSNAWQWSLNAHSHACLRYLVTALQHEEAVPRLVLTDGRAGSLSIAMSSADDGGLQLHADGPVDASTRAALGAALFAEDWSTLLPAFIADDLYIDAFEMAMHKDASITAWHLRAHWEGGALELRMENNQCQLLSFKDKRLPAFSVAEGRASCMHLQADSVRCTFDVEQRSLLLHVTSPKQNAVCAVIPDNERIIIKALQLPVAAEHTPLPAYVPPWLLDAIDGDIDFSSSTFDWNDEPEHRGKLQASAALTKGGAVQLRAQWNQSDLFSLQGALVRMPKLQLTCDLHLQAAYAELSRLNILEMQKNYKDLLESVNFTVCRLSTIKNDQHAAVMLGLSQGKEPPGAFLKIERERWELNFKSIKAVLLNTLLHRDVLGSGTAAYVSVSRDPGNKLRLTCDLNNAYCSWPMPDWRCDKGQLIYETDERGDLWQWTDAGGSWAYYHPAGQAEGIWKSRTPITFWDWHSKQIMQTLRIGW